MYGTPFAVVSGLLMRCVGLAQKSVRWVPPGLGPCLHSRNDTFETFMVLAGRIEYRIGGPVEHANTKLGPGARDLPLRFRKWRTEHEE